MKVPEAYSSVSISKAGDAPSVFADFKKVLVNAKYEQYLEVNRENSSALSYYFKKANNNSNEIVVLRQYKEQISAIYIKGDINISQVDQYLNRIRSSLSRLGTVTQMPSYFPDGELSAFFDTAIYQESVQHYMAEARESAKQVMKEHKEQMNDLMKTKSKAMEQALKNRKEQTDQAIQEMEKEESALPASH